MGLFREKVKQYLTEKYKDILFDAAWRGEIETIKRLINKIDVNVKDNDDWTALMVASLQGYKEIVELLIKAGADVNVKDNDDWTALMVASNNGHKEIVELLRKYGAEI